MSSILNFIFFSIEDTRKLWTVKEASSKLAVPPDGGPEWSTRFKVIKVDKKIHLFLKKQVYSVHDTRHDLSFLTPSKRKVRCKVRWKCSSFLLRSKYF